MSPRTSGDTFLPGGGRVLGTTVPRSEWHPNADIVGAVERSGAGNAVVRIGQEDAGAGSSWHQTAHVVLVPSEVRVLVDELVVAGRTLGDPADVARIRAAYVLLGLVTDETLAPIVRHDTQALGEILTRIDEREL